MAAFTWIQMSSLLTLMLQFKGTTEQHQTVTAGRGHDVTLPCKNAIQGQHNCGSTDWIFSDSSSSVSLFNLGQNKEAKPKSDRLSLSADCSLVIKNVTYQDVGHYTCRQFKTRGGSQEGPDFMIHLSVINKPATTKSTTVTSTTKTSSTTKSTTSTTSEETSNNPSGVQSWFIIVPVGLAALLVVVVIIIWKKTKENKTQQSDNTAEADDEVSYASISFTKKTKSKDRPRVDDDGETMTYSTVKTFSPPAGVSTDSSDLYSTINKPKT
ncbi:uncharacterized protein LOC109200537 [Oreochromis niloticus]|uniref:uncharacterized protein LOC109200537 n=1 Tax=Oreochromis niloticus TaxID=8128 RepID=UPI000DF42886|nr:uncharacterized protein LOC109200537 [Oreochromis niloticus]